MEEPNIILIKEEVEKILDVNIRHDGGFLHTFIFLVNEDDEFYLCFNYYPDNLITNNFEQTIKKNRMSIKDKNLLTFLNNKFKPKYYCSLINTDIPIMQLEKFTKFNFNLLPNNICNNKISHTKGKILCSKIQSKENDELILNLTNSFDNLFNPDDETNIYNKIREKEDTLLLFIKITKINDELYTIKIYDNNKITEKINEYNIELTEINKKFNVNQLIDFNFDWELMHLFIKKIIREIQLNNIINNGEYIYSIVSYIYNRINTTKILGNLYGFHIDNNIFYNTSYVSLQFLLNENEILPGTIIQDYNEQNKLVSFGN
jgi:hypothetical protein